MRPNLTRLRPTRRGITLLEMLVTVALLLLMMVILVQIFRSALGSISTQRTYAALDEGLRRIDSTIRQDLTGITARLDASRPASKHDNLGYFEYIENELADLQGEDTDDILAFTAKAPESQPFVGRAVLLTDRPLPLAPVYEPVSVTSRFAEVIYFLRDGNLYRRVLLIAPERNGSLRVGGRPRPLYEGTRITPNTFGGFEGSFAGFTAPGVSWQGLNDISARPAPVATGAGPGPVNIPAIPVANSLSDLTERHNRFARPRFSDDFRNTSDALVPDGSPDDSTAAPALANGVPDYYPILYPNLLAAQDANSLFLVNERNPNTGANVRNGSRLINYNSMPFPFIYPGSYSKPSPADVTTGGLAPFGAIHFLGVANHYPVLQGESSYFNVPTSSNVTMPVPTTAAQSQTYWGMPTWKETMSPNWIDPIRRHNVDGEQPVGWPTAYASGVQAPGQSWVGFAALPPIPGPFSDGAGSSSFAMPVDVFQDDLILTNVRSFDVKAYDPNAVAYIASNAAGSRLVSLPIGYYDLGYGLVPPRTGIALTSIPPGSVAELEVREAEALRKTFAHEGRVPPLTGDFRLDSQWPFIANGSLPAPIGDDATNLIRLRRTYDTWSTTYSNAPAIPLNPFHGPPFIFNGQAMRPVYPSYEAPYPTPLRGIQIQIRVVDPENQKIKTLTIRQDFSTKL